MGEIIFHIGIFITMGIFYNELGNVNVNRVTDVVGPVGFPKVFLILGMILTLISLYQTIKKYRKQENKEFKLNMNVQFYGIIISMILFTLLLGKLGFVISGFLLLVALLYNLGESNNVKVFTISTISILVFTLLFGRILSVPLPRGLGLLKEISYLLY